MKKFCQFFKMISNRRFHVEGSALSMVLFVGSLVAASGIMLLNSGQVITNLGRSNAEKTFVNSVVQDIKSGLSERGTCTAARDGGFVNLGGYAQGARIDQSGALEAGTNITLNWVINNLPAGYFNPDPDPVNIAQIDVITLNFTIVSNSRAARTLSSDIFIQNFQTNINTAAGNEEDFCMSFEYGSGSQQAIDTFCDNTLGGTLNADGSCNLDAPGNDVLENGDFQREVRNFACSIIGGTYGVANNPCDEVNIAGPLHSELYFNDNPNDRILLDDSSDIRSAFIDHNCPANSVAVGFNPDGSLNCQAIDCNDVFNGGSEPVFSSYAIVDTGSGYQCRCQRDFTFGNNMHNVTLTSPVDSNRYNTGSETANGSDMHAMISPWKRPSDYNGSASSNNNKTIGCNDEDPYACRDYDWNDGCALGTTCTILRGRFPGCGVTTTSEHKVIINACNDICAFGPGCDTSDLTSTGTRADGCLIENDPLPPSITCSGQTVSGACTVPEAGAGSNNVAGTCAGGQIGSCTVNCSSTGTWDTPDTSSCTSPTSACNGLADTTEYDNLSSCSTQGMNPNYWSCEVRSTKFCRIGQSCDRSTLSIPNGTITTSVGYDIADQSYGGSVVCDDAGTPPTVTCDGSSGNYNISGSCGSVATCNSTLVTWASGQCENWTGAIYTEGSVITVWDNTTSMRGNASFVCQSSGTWALVSGDPENCTSSSGNCANSALNPPNATISTSSGNTPNGNGYSGTITCNSGYSGSISASCSGSSWNISGSCSPIVCENSIAPTVSNGSFPSSGDTSGGGSLAGTCDGGYTGTISAQCNADGSWGAVTGSCTPVCVPPSPSTIACGITDNSCPSNPVTGTDCSASPITPYCHTTGGYCASCLNDSHCDAFNGESCLAGVCACFIEGTKVLMADGSQKDIVEVKVGDVLKGINQNNTVLKLKRNQYRGKVYSINGSDYFVTAGHPFMTTEGWKSFNPQLAMEINPTLDIGQLKVGDILVTDSGNIAVDKLDFIIKSTPVYNFEVSGEKVYYADGFLVHNK